MYYPYSKNKGADQLHSDCDADLCLCFGIGKTPAFSSHMSCFNSTGLELRVYGSSLTGFGLKTSDLNLDLLVPEGSNPAQLLTKVYKVLNNSGMLYNNVEMFFCFFFSKT